MCWPKRRFHMSIESGPGGPEHSNPELSDSPIGTGEVSESELENRPRLTDQEKDSLHTIDVTEEDEAQLFANNNGKRYQMSEVLELKGIQPDSGKVKLRWSD